MNTRNFAVLLIVLFSTYGLKAQITNIDSASVAKSLANLLSICKNVDFGDPDVQKLGTFYKAAPFIVYRGEDEKRAWKDVANYRNPDEKAGVDEVCFKINNGINQDENYMVTGYHTETESEGTWYVLMVSYIRKGVEKNAAFAFLKINGVYALGDID